MKIKSKYRPYFINDSIILGQNKCQIRLNECSPYLIRIIKELSSGLSKNEIMAREDSDDIFNIIEQLDDVGIIENDEYDSEEQYIQRYKNNFYYFENFSNINMNAEKIQKKLNNVKVLAIGVGGASVLIASLVAMGIENITLIDFDKIEMGNLNRQLLYSERAIGKDKLDETEKFLLGINSSCNVKKINMKVSSPEDIDNLIQAHDIVINAIDTPPIESNRWVNLLCHKYNRPLFYMGVGPQEVYVDKFTYQKDGCYDCMLLNQLENDYDDTKKNIEEIYNGNYSALNTSFMPNILLTSGILAMEIFKYVVLGDENDFSQEIDLINNHKEEHRHHKNDKCPVCKNNKLEKIEDLIKLAGTKNDRRKYN